MPIRNGRHSYVPEGPFTRSRVARYTDLPDEVLAHWTKEGLLKPIQEVAGTGRHKEFDAYEVGKAAILGEMRSLGSGIDALRWFSDVMDKARFIADTVPGCSLDRTYALCIVMEAYNMLLAGKRVTVTDYEDRSFGKVPARDLNDLINDQFRPGELKAYPGLTLEIIEEFVLKHHTDLQMIQAADVAAPLDESLIGHRGVEGIWLIWKDGDGWKVFSSPEANMSGLAEPPLGGIMLYVTRILRRLWSVRL